MCSKSTLRIFGEAQRRFSFLNFLAFILEDKNVLKADIRAERFLTFRAYYTSGSFIFTHNLAFVVTSWKDKKQHKIMKSTTDTECPLGDCSREGEYINRQTDFKENELELDPTSTVCEVYAFIRYTSTNNVILWLEKVNQMMGLWILTTLSVFRIPLLSDSASEKFLASQETSGPKVTRKLFG